MEAGSVALNVKVADVWFVGFAGPPTAGEPGLFVSIAYDRTAEAVEVFPTPSTTAPAAISNVTFPSLFGGILLAVNEYGPAPLPETAKAAQPVEAGAAPPNSTSPAANPVTGLLNVTKQLKLVAFVGVVDGVHENAVTVGARRSTVQFIRKPLAVVALLPNVSVAPKLPDRAAEEVPVEVEPIVLARAIVHRLELVWVAETNVAAVSEKSEASSVEHVMFSLPLIVNDSAVLLVGVVLWPPPVRVGAVVSIV